MKIAEVAADREVTEVGELAAPRAYLADDTDQRKLYQLSSRLASLFDDYQLYRGDLLRDFASGTVPEPGPARWQAALWRRLLDSASPRLGAFDEPLDQALTRLIEDSAQRRPAGLPRRLSVLGVASLPPVFIDLLSALGRHLPVTVYLVSPTYHYWADLRSERETARLERRFRRSDDLASGSRPVRFEDQHFDEGHPLLASLGKQGRELFDLLQRADSAGAFWHELSFDEPPGEGALQVLQRDVLHLTDRRHGERVPLLREDRSLRLHLCHSPMREMQVLRHQLLHAFDQLDGLRPSDVLVLVPDIERYGPYIQAVFGAASSGDVPVLPFSIADRGAGREQPPSEVVVQLLDLAGARLTLRQIFDLLEVPAVRRARGLAEDDVPTLRRLVSAAGVRWGLSGEHKQRLFDVPADDSNTWRAGLDRLLMGYAVGRVDSPDHDSPGLEFDSPVEHAPGGDIAGLVAGVAPASGDTAGGAGELGRFVEFVDQLEKRLDELRRRRPLREWAGVLAALVDDFLLAESEEEERGLQLVRDTAEQLALAAERIAPGGTTAELSLRVVREHLDAALRVEGFGSGFMNGQITFCALKPMRTIPFRVIAVCGLDAGVFPRRDRRPGFDLMANDPRPGDRSVRDDDRYLFLETLLAAGDRLILTHVGRSQQDGTERQPSAVISELLDQIDRTFITEDEGPARQQLTVIHPLQPWSETYFTGSAEHFSYAAEDARTAEQLRGERRSEPNLLAEIEIPSAAPRPDGLRERTVDDLVRFWQAPSRWYLQQGLGITLDTGERQASDAEPFALRGLDGWPVLEWLTERRLEERAAGQASDPDSERRLLRARGELPAATLGDAALASATRLVEAFLERVPRHQRLAPLAVDLQLMAPSSPSSPTSPTSPDGAGWRLLGVLDSATDLGILRYRCGHLRAKDWLHVAIEHLVHQQLTRDSGDAWLIGTDGAWRLSPSRDPAARLVELLTLMDQGEHRPLPMLPETSLAFAEHQLALVDPRRRSSRPPIDVARAVFEGREGPPRDQRPSPEMADPWIRLAFRGLDPLDQADFESLASRLWRPILEAREPRR